MKKNLLLIFVLIPFLVAFPQQGRMITVIGDSLVGKMVNGESTREVYGNVNILQGNVKITCDKAIHFISRNEAEPVSYTHLTLPTSDQV